MKCPLTKEQIQEFMNDLDDKAKETEWLKSQRKRYDDINNEQLDKNEIFEGNFKDLLYDIYRFKHADMLNDLKNFNDEEFIEQFFGDGLQICIKLNDFVVIINKPTTFGEMSVIKKALVDNLSYDAATDIIVLQKILPDIIKIYRNEHEIKQISAINYMDASVFFFATPIIYQMLLLMINSLGAFTRKK